MSNPIKNYKIIVDSKHFGNMKGIRPAEVVKKAAGGAAKVRKNHLAKKRMVSVEA